MLVHPPFQNISSRKNSIVSQATPTTKSVPFCIMAGSQPTMTCTASVVHHGPRKCRKVLSRGLRGSRYYFLRTRGTFPQTLCTTRQHDEVCNTHLYGLLVYGWLHELRLDRHSKRKRVLMFALQLNASNQSEPAPRREK